MVALHLEQSVHQSFCEPMPGWPNLGRTSFLVSGFGLVCSSHLCMTRKVQIALVRFHG